MTTTLQNTVVTTAKRSTEVYGAGITRRATVAEMEFRRSTLLQIAEDAQPASVRHIYYRAVVAGLVPKTQAGYQKVQRQLLDLRRDGRLPFSWIVDEGRRAHWPIVDSSPASALQYLAESYRRDPWQLPGMPRVELWCESESIAGMLMPLKDKYAVPIFPLKGQGSESFVWSAAQSYRAWRPVVVLYAGDYDPAGLQISAQNEGKLRTYSDVAVSIDFRRLAITDEQAVTLQELGTPAKQSWWLDFHGVRHEFVGQAVEAEAVDPKVMRQLFSSTIENVAVENAGYDVFADNAVIERRDRQELLDLVGRWSE